MFESPFGSGKTLLIAAPLQQKNESKVHVFTILLHFYFSFRSVFAIIESGGSGLISVRRTADLGVRPEVCDDIAIDRNAVRNYHLGYCKRNSSYQTLIHPARSADRAFPLPTGGLVKAFRDHSGVKRSAKTFS